MKSLGVAIVGCGYVADFYLATIRRHPSLHLIGVFDLNHQRASTIAAEYGVRNYKALSEVLSDPQVDIIANLTSVESHFQLSRQGLEAGKHVYSEKPLATTMSESRELGLIADRLKLVLLSAPCSVLGATAATVKKIIQEGELGRPLLAYAELDDGPIYLMPHETWLNRWGSHWPYRDEMRAGCVIEHAGYYLTWLVDLFGLAHKLVSYSKLIVPPEQKKLLGEQLAPDFAVSCIEFNSGITARITCGIVAPENHGLTIACENGVIKVAEAWNYASPVLVQRRLGHRAPEKEASTSFSHTYLSDYEVYPTVYNESVFYQNTHNMDFSRGIAEIPRLVASGGDSPLSHNRAIHVLDLALLMNSTGVFERIPSTSSALGEWRQAT